MNWHFWLTLLSSCSVGGLFVALTTLASEKLSGSWGGLVGGLPVLECVTSISLGLIVGAEEVSKAMLVCPIAGFVGTLTFIMWVYLPPFLAKHGIRSRKIGITLVVVINVTIWLGASVPLSLWGIDALIAATSTASLVTLSILFLSLTWMVGSILKFFEFTPPPPSSAKVTIWTYLLRGSCGAFLMLIVCLASELSSTLSGALSSFPIFSLTSFSALWLSNGYEIVGFTASSMGLGDISAYGYTVIFALCVMKLNIWWSCLIALVASFFGMSVPLLLILNKRDAMLKKHIGCMAISPAITPGISSSERCSTSTDGDGDCEGSGSGSTSGSDDQGDKMSSDDHKPAVSMEPIQSSAAVMV